MNVLPYPLTWPEGFPRSQRRDAGAFKTSLANAIKNVKDSLRLFGEDSRRPITDAVISSNVTLGVAVPVDPGVAVWFTWDGKPVCIPVDRYSKVEANLQAIHHVLEARRVELRHGTLALVRASMAGLLALPSPKRWQDVLDVKPPYDLAKTEARYIELARSRHHDAIGGDESMMVELNVAIAAARKELAA